VLSLPDNTATKPEQQKGLCACFSEVAPVYIISKNGYKPQKTPTLHSLSSGIGIFCPLNRRLIDFFKLIHPIATPPYQNRSRFLYKVRHSADWIGKSKSQKKCRFCT